MYLEIYERIIQHQSSIIREGRRGNQEGNVFDSYYNAVYFFAHSRSKSLIKLLLDLIDDSKYELSDTDYSEIRDGIIDSGVEYLEPLLEHISEHPLASSSWDYCSRVLSEFIEYERLNQGFYVKASEMTLPIIKIALEEFLGIQIRENNISIYNNYMRTLKECLLSVDLSKYDNSFVSSLKDLLWRYFHFFMSQDDFDAENHSVSAGTKMDINLLIDTLNCMYLLQQDSLIGALKKSVSKITSKSTAKQYINWFLEGVFRS